MNIGRLRLITFDVTDTLLQFRYNPGKQYGDIGAIYGVMYDNRALAQNFKTHWIKMNKDHPNFGLNSGLGWDKWWRSVVHSTFYDSNQKLYDYKKMDAIATHLIESYKTSACWQLCYGAEDLLKYLKHTNITVGVISNFDQRLSILLRNMKIDHYFKFILCSFDAASEKPNKKIFETALKISGLNILPEEALHIGNKIEIDYYGATNAGWNSILIYDKNCNSLKKNYPDFNTSHLFRNLYEFNLHLKEMST